MAAHKARATAQRVHIVLVPGFAGFDALGQLEYYYGVTPLFQAMKAAQNGVLHFFDNLPTAAVVTRAHRLHKYLARRIARGDIKKGDEIALIGHSTGGLDIRQLVLDLSSQRRAITVDGGVHVEGAQILDGIKRVVFLSVPHYGTSLADAIAEYTFVRKLVVEQLRLAVAGSQVPLVEHLENWMASFAGKLTGSELLQAVQDSLQEASLNDPADPTRTAAAQEADSQLSLYVRQIATNFRAIDDLTTKLPKSGTLSPAHFDDAARKKERRLWNARSIRARSYATLGKSPDSRSDAVYRTVYNACAAGQFKPPDCAQAFPGITAPENDGIVNTQSMCWHEGESKLIHADHMDIVGHFRLVKSVGDAPRTHHAYDLLKSNSGFHEKQFAEVWRDVFAFCAHA